jgi:uncharacterized protein
MNQSLSNSKAPSEGASLAITNRDLFLPYLAPYFGYVLLASFLADRIAIEINYAVRLVVTTALLAWAWRWYVPLRGPKNQTASIIVGIVFGLVGCFVWVVLMMPFVDPAGGDEWSDTGFYLRIVAASLIVPIFEELFMRGYIFRVALQWDQARHQGNKRPFEKALDKSCLNNVSPGAWSAWAIAISTVAFALGHHTAEWPAAIAYGLLMVMLWIVRKDLLSCIVAHGATNFALAVYVKLTGQWGFW